MIDTTEAEEFAKEIETLYKKYKRVGVAIAVNKRGEIELSTMLRKFVNPQEDAMEFLRSIIDNFNKFEPVKEEKDYE